MKNRRGFTTVELIVAITVLTLGLLGLVSVSGYVSQMLGRGDRAATASFYAAEQLEEFYGLGCSVIAPAGSATKGGIYALSWKVGPVLNSARPVELVVDYPGARGRMRSDTLETSVLCLR